MNAPLNRCPPQQLLAAALCAWLVATHAPAVAAPGAHGPNGEHLDSPTATQATAARPRLEAQSELFELVATLHGSELSVFVDRYASNEPVLQAQLDVESGGVKAKATFHTDQGDYSVDDPKFLALLRGGGEHALVFTLVAGQDSDLLDGTLVTTAGGVTAGANSDHGHPHGGDEHGGDDHGHGQGHGHPLDRAGWMGAGVAALGLIGGIAWWRQRRRAAGKPLGGR